MAGEKFIKKIRLSDGSVYYFYDVTAAREAELANYLALSGGTMTGNVTVDAILTAKHLHVVSINDRDIAVSNVLTQDVATGEIQKRDANELLSDIGGCSFSFDDNQGILALKNGK